MKPRPADPIPEVSKTHLPHGRFIANRAYFGLRQKGRNALEISRAHSRKQGFMPELASVVLGERIMRPSLLKAATIRWGARDEQETEQRT